MARPVGIVPIVGDARDALREPPRYHSGRILKSVQVQPVFWGRAWQDSLSDLPPKLEMFFQSILRDPWMDVVREYSVPNFTIGYGTLLPTVRVPDSEPGGASRVIEDADVKRQIHTWVSNGTVDSGSAFPDVMYFVFLPPGVTAVMEGEKSCDTMCGYHHRTDQGDVYAVVPYLDCALCSHGGAVLDNLTVVASHELAEAITDPLPPTGWYPEVADPCSGNTARIGPWSVQKIWSTFQQQCTATPTWRRNELTHLTGAEKAFRGTALDGYATPWTRQQHVNFVDDANQVHELWYTDDEGWKDQKLTALLSAQPALWRATDGYVTPWNEQQHVNFVDIDDSVHEFVYDEGRGWDHNLLTPVGSATATPRGGLDGYASRWNRQQHVNFIDSAGHVQEVVYEEGGSSWLPHDLTVESGGPPARPGSALAGYVSPWNKQQHVIYVDNTNLVQELVWDDGAGAWAANELSQSHGGLDVGRAGDVVGYCTEWNTQQHVIYVDINGQVNELYYAEDSGWRRNNLTSRTMAPTASPDAGLAAFTTDWNHQQHVNFIDDDGNVHELMFDGDAWHDTDLTFRAHATKARKDSPLAGYATPWNKQWHVIFIDVDGAVVELWYEG